ncbi:MAG: inorganic diphosphatase [Mycoplasma sp.]
MLLKLEATIEIEKGSKIKYEIDKKTNQLRVDRILFGSNTYPHNYGFINNTLDWDGDELDIVIISDQSFIPNSLVPTKVIGALEMIDGGEIDTKLVGVIDCDPRYNHINSLKELGEHSILEIKDFFENYKNLQSKKVEIKGIKETDWAINEYNECVELYNKYGKLSKEDFLNKMKKEFPNKYI